MRLIFDVSTTLRTAYDPPVGITRVERTVLADLMRVLGADNITLANFDDGRFVPVSPAERELVRAVIESPAQQAPRPGATATEPVEVPGQGALAGRSRLVRRLPVLRSLAHAYLAIFPPALKQPAATSAWEIYSGTIGTLRVLARAARTPRKERRVAAAARALRPAPSYPPLVTWEKQHEAFAGHTDLITIGNGWDYLHYLGLRDLKDRFGLRVHGFVHDLIAVDYPYFFHDPASASKIHQHYAELCHICDTLTCNSYATRSALRRFIAEEDLPEPHVAVAQLPTFGDEADRLEPRAPVGFDGGDFVLFVSTIEVRKNHQILLHTWRECLAEGRPMPRLVFVGRMGWGVDPVLAMLRHDPRLRDHVQVLHDITDEELAWLYDRCLFTVYPSVVEGWGLPVSEALGRGRICLHAADPAQKEAAQNLMPAIHPYDLVGWKAAILDLIERPHRRERLEADIRERFRGVTREQFCAAVRDATGLGRAGTLVEEAV